MTPNTFIVGAPKTGTTSLAQYLSEHDNVFFCVPKEPFYLCHDFPHLKAQHFLKDDADYLALFAKADPAQHSVVAEGSTNYLRSEVAVKEALKLNPEARFIAILRHPVELVHAFHMEQIFARNEDQKDFETAWDLQESRARGENLSAECSEPDMLQYRAVASLAAQVQRFIDTVPEGQRLIFLQDDLKADTGAVYRQTLAFLGLPDDGRTEFPVANAARAHRSEWIAKLVLSPPPLLRGPMLWLRQVLRERRPPFVEWIKAKLRKPEKRAALSPAFEQRLNDTFAADIDALETLLGRDLSGWRR